MWLPGDPLLEGERAEAGLRRAEPLVLVDGWRVEAVQHVLRQDVNGRDPIQERRVDRLELEHDGRGIGRVDLGDLVPADPAAHVDVPGITITS